MNLDKLTEQEREQYYQDVCKAVGLPPELRLLEFIYVDGGDAQRKLVLYALKGATEHLRKINGISITSLVKDVGDGYIAWIATGTDRTGRTEMSTGAASTRGVNGEGLAKAVALAQTRAVRRMTLQFVGAGILDESEINEKTTNISSASTLPVPIMPTIAPSSAPGKDVTPDKSNLADELRQSLTDAIAYEKGENVGLRVTEVKSTPVFAPVSPNAEVRKSPGPGPKRSVYIPIAPTESRAHEAMAELETLPQQTVPKMCTTVHEMSTAPSAVVAVPSTKDEVNQKIYHYRTEVLEPAGLAPSSGMGIFAKIKTAMKVITNTDDEKSLEKWAEFFAWIEQGVQAKGAQAVVAEINQRIGATE